MLQDFRRDSHPPRRPELRPATRSSRGPGASADGFSMINSSNWLELRTRSLCNIACSVSGPPWLAAGSSSSSASAGFATAPPSPQAARLVLQQIPQHLRRDRRHSRRLRPATPLPSPPKSAPPRPPARDPRPRPPESQSLRPPAATSSPRAARLIMDSAPRRRGSTPPCAPFSSAPSSASRIRSTCRREPARARARIPPATFRSTTPCARAER